MSLCLDIKTLHQGRVLIKKKNNLSQVKSVLAVMQPNSIDWWHHWYVPKWMHQVAPPLLDGNLLWYASPHNVQPTDITRFLTD